MSIIPLLDDISWYSIIFQLSQSACHFLSQLRQLRLDIPANVKHATVFEFDRHLGNQLGCTLIFIAYTIALLGIYNSPLLWLTIRELSPSFLPGMFHMGDIQTIQPPHRKIEQRQRPKKLGPLWPHRGAWELRNPTYAAWCCFFFFKYIYI
jgi:hypothetical protein